MSMIRHLFRSIAARLPPRAQCFLISLRNYGSPRLGCRTYVHHSAQLLGKAFIRIGSNSVVCQDVWMNVNDRQGKQYAIEIGNHCFIGRRNFFSSGRKIQFGDYVLTANDCHFLGSSHNTSNPMLPVITTGTTSSDVIIVGSNCFIGAGAQVVGEVRIGHGCVVGAGSVVINNLPPFSMAHGCPAVVRKRYSFPRNMWVSAEDFSGDDELALPSERDYLAILKAVGQIHMPYIACGSDMGNC